MSIVQHDNASESDFVGSKEADELEPELTTDKEEDFAPIGHYFVRFGTFMLSLTAPNVDRQKAYNSIVESLKEDSRVENVEAEPFRAAWSSLSHMYPPKGSTQHELLSGCDGFPAFSMPDAITLKIRVPEKNQPLFRGEADVPTDTYSVVWDGITAAVLWECEADDELPPRSAGHVIHEILNLAAERSGYGIVQQACSPGCTNLFAHRVVRVFQVPSEDGEAAISRFRKRSFPLTDVIVACDGDGTEVLRLVGHDLLTSGKAFASFKNLSRRLLSIESLARELAGDLLELDYQLITDRRRNVFVRSGRFVARLWSSENPQTQSRELIASLWLLMAAMETLKRDWEEARRHFKDVTSKRGRQRLYIEDRKSDEADVDSLNVAFIRAAVEQKSSAIDTRLIAAATASGAIAAVLVGLAAMPFT